tara:strand:- start:5990 stop:7924 length:1935 start_codon:yes stop_codon:yes gene_type:complete
LAVLKKTLFLFVLFFCLGVANGQDINSFSSQTDSLLEARMRARDAEAQANTQNYNARSTRFTYEKNFKFNNIVFRHPDTLPDNMHRVSDLERNRYLIQNLGNVGTAQRSLFYEPANTIGRSSGYHAYDAFATTPDQIRYFDTRSPYTDIQALFAGGGRSITRVTFTFNDSTQFNIGMNFNSIRADKQVAFLTRGDRHVNSNDWNIFGFLRPKGLKKYLLLFNTTQFKHTVSEQGGVVDPSLLTGNNPQNKPHSYFDGRDANVNLSGAESYDKRGGFHIYQQYDLDSIFQVYHSGQYAEQLVRYYDAYDLSGFDQYIYNEATPGKTRDTVAEGSFFRELLNEVGLKGRTKKFSYTAYYKNRALRYQIFRENYTGRDLEHYVGGTLRQQITPEIFLTASGEFMFEGNYRIEGDFTSSFFEARFTRLNRQPSYLVDRYNGQQRSWTNDFSAESADHLTGTLKLNGARVSFRPFVRFSRISNYIFFNENKLPEQANSDVLLLTPGAHFDWQLTSRIRWSNTVHYTSVSGGSANNYRVPQLLALSQIAFKNEIFDGKMIVHTGIEAYYRSAYEGLAYDPVVQQFYLQNGFENNEYVKADVFLNFKVGNFLFLVKMAHVNQLSQKGYFVTPTYPGTGRTLDMGVRWLFFD